MMARDLKSRLFEQFNYEKSIVPIIAVQSILSSLQLLDSLHITIYPMIHRATVKRTFSLGFSLMGVMILFMLATFQYMMLEKRNWEILMSISASICIGLFTGVEVAVSIFSLGLVVITLMSSRRFQEYLTWLLAPLAIFEGLALTHWVMLPFGVVSPLAWFADLEMSLFYVASYLAPLLILPLIFMWVLKPVLRWVFLKEDDDEDIV